MTLQLIEAFVLGLLTPITAACVLPLYPGFLVYLANQAKVKHSLALFGLLITAGVITFMFLLGLLFTTILQVSLTNVIQVVSPIAFVILIIISIVLIFNLDIGKYIPKFRTPTSKNPILNALLFGFFFGAIVVPCNPAFIAALFTRAVTTLGFLTNILQFLFFGIGLASPLLAFSLVSQQYGQQVINTLLKYKTNINRTAGAIMLVVSVYYLVFVFRVFG